MTPKQREFARQYAKNPEVRSSARAAGYSENYAKTKAKVLLSNPDIVSEIQRLRIRMNERADKSATDVVNEYSKIAFTDRVSFLKDDPIRPGEFMYKSPDELTPDERSVVESVNMTVRKVEVVDALNKPITVHRQEYRYILSDKANALQQMGRHFGIFDDKLKLIATHANPFKNASPDQLTKLRESFIGIMHKPDAIEGKVIEVKRVKK